MLKNISAKFCILTLVCGSLLTIIVMATQSSMQFNQIIGLGLSNSHLSDATSLVHQTRYHTVQVQQFLTDVSATGEREGFQDAEKHAQAARESMAELKQLLPNKASEIEASKKQLDQFYKIGLEMANAYLTGGREAGNRLMVRSEDGFDALSILLTNNLEQLLKEIQLEYQDSNSNLTTSIKDARQLSLILSFIACLVIGLGGWGTYLKLIPPLCRLKNSLRDIASGSRDLTCRLPAEHQDEIGHVEQAFNQFVDTIQLVLTDVIQLVHKVNGANSDLGNVYKRTMHSMNALHGETDQVATAMNEMNATVQDVASNASKSSEIATSANTAVQEGQVVILQSSEAISLLADNVSSATNIIEQLQEHAGQIGSIVDVIRGISEQTNLLALNAAIEAARAGEQGRGFAVVADEVRTLAQRTQDATTQIQEMIEQLQSGAQGAVQVMGDGRKQAEVTVELTEKAQEALGKITESVASCMDMNTQIATAAEEQSYTAEEINRNICNIATQTDLTMSEARQTGAFSAKSTALASQTSLILDEFEVGKVDLDPGEDVIIQWCERTLSIGVPSMDTQHKKLVDLINQLYQSLRTNQGREGLSKVLDGVLTYAQTHLKDEEALLEKAGYPGLNEHKNIHDNLLVEAIALKQTFDEGKTAVAHDLLMFLEEWLIEHIVKEDKKYVGFINQQKSK